MEMLSDVSDVLIGLPCETLILRCEFSNKSDEKDGVLSEDFFKVE